jgi:hypothetical protein
LYRYNKNHHDDRRGHGDNDRRNDRRCDNQQPEDCRDERDLPPPPEIGNPNGPFQQAKRWINMIVGGLKSSSSRRRYRKDNHEVQLIHTKPSQPLRWSEQPITFSRADHWVHIQDLGSYPLVVEPIVEGAMLPQTLIDGGSGLNIILVDTLKKMDFDFKRLTECDEPFFAIVPGKAAYPLGRISLLVTFGTEDNFRTEYLRFEVADFKSSYHAILGRPMPARFMAIPHYTYLVLKMSAPRRILIVYGDLFVSFKCDNGDLSWWPRPRRSPRPTSPSRSRSAPRPLWMPFQRRRRYATALPTQPRRWSSVTTSGEIGTRTHQILPRQH